jgi:hypothetical protein
MLTVLYIPKPSDPPQFHSKEENLATATLDRNGIATQSQARNLDAGESDVFIFSTMTFP